MILSVATLAPEAYPPAGQAVLARYKDPYAVYGYGLDTIRGRNLR